MNEKHEVKCPKCGKFLFNHSSDGERFYFMRGVKYVVQSAKCCGITVTGFDVLYNASRTESTGLMADATAPTRAAD